MKTAKRIETRKLVLLGLLTAIVVVLQALAAVLPVYPFTLTLSLVPMVIGAALVSPLAGGWLGLVFGFVVLITGNANPFLVISPIATVLLCLAKGAFAGLLAGVVYHQLAKKSKTVATIVAAMVCPIVNTGIFVIGCYTFFLPTLKEWAAAFDFENATAYIFLGMISFNFIFEVVINIVLSPVIIRLVQYGQDRKVTA